MKPRAPNLYIRLFLWFCVANVVTLLVSVFVTERFARMAYATEPDWTGLAESANAAYLRGGDDALEDWSRDHHRDGVDGTLFEGERNLLRRPLPPPIRFNLDKLLAEDSVVLRPREGVIVAGQRVVGNDGVVRHLIGWRGSRPPPTRIGELLIVQIALSLMIIGALGWFVARGISKPIAALQAATRRMAAGELSARVGEKWTRRDDELGRLAADFDRMAGRIEALVAHERGVLQDVSHELRSPLARLHLLLDLLRRTPAAEAAPHFDRAEREILRLDRIIGEALALARMEGQLPGMEAESIPLDALILHRIDISRIDADARGITLHCQDRPPTRIRGSTDLIERAIDNLLSNAIKFSPEGASIEISLRREAEYAELAIRDHGPGVPEDELASLFRPFFRGSNAPKAEGHGLGLAIAQRIAVAHGGSVRIANVERDGLCVTLSLPVAG